MQCYVRILCTYISSGTRTNPADDVQVVDSRGGLGVEGDATGTAPARSNVPLPRMNTHHLHTESVHHTPCGHLHNSQPQTKPESRKVYILEQVFVFPVNVPVWML